MINNETGVLQRVVQAGMDIDDVLYQSPAGPIAVHDVLYGYGKEIEKSGKDFFAHKRGFTPKSLRRALESAGFAGLKWMYDGIDTQHLFA